MKMIVKDISRREVLEEEIHGSLTVGVQQGEDEDSQISDDAE